MSVQVRIGDNNPLQPFMTSGPSLGNYPWGPCNISRIGKSPPYNRGRRFAHVLGFLQDAQATLALSDAADHKGSFARVDPARTGAVNRWRKCPDPSRATAEP
jgi:hypothetical protein